MNLHNYLIEQAGLDWERILSDWVPPLPEQFTIWLVNRFGDIFAVYEDGSVNWLAMDTGQVTRMASSRDEFCELVDVGENANSWLMIPLVDACVAAGKVLGPGQCYGYKMLPILGGLYKVDNIAPMTLHEYYPFLADMYSQLADLPDGTKVRLVIKPRNG